MNPERVQQRNMGFESAYSGHLEGYALKFNKRSVKYPGAASANVVPNPASKVEGVLYELSDPDQIYQMDPYEGYPVRYTRLLTSVARPGLTTVESWVYIANEEYVQEGLMPATWYLNHLLAGKPYLSSDYYHALSQTTCLPKSDLEPE